MSNKSAKDLAFDRERAKYRKQINELKVLLREKDDEISEANERCSKAESRCEEFQYWIDRLLAYTEMTEEDMKKLIEKEKDATDVMKCMSKLFDFTKAFY